MAERRVADEVVERRVADEVVEWRVADELVEWSAADNSKTRIILQKSSNLNPDDVNGLQLRNFKLFSKVSAMEERLIRVFCYITNNTGAEKEENICQLKIVVQSCFYHLL